MDALTGIIDFLTDPAGVGFPILIGGGLGVILFLMRFSTKEQKHADKEIRQKKDITDGRYIPRRPL